MITDKEQVNINVEEYKCIMVDIKDRFGFGFEKQIEGVIFAITRGVECGAKMTIVQAERYCRDLNSIGFDISFIPHPRECNYFVFKTTIRSYADYISSKRHSLLIPSSTK
jgi:hypothetical protein